MENVSHSEDTDSPSSSPPPLTSSSGLHVLHERKRFSLFTIHMFMCIGLCIFTLVQNTHMITCTDAYCVINDSLPYITHCYFTPRTLFLLCTVFVFYALFFRDVGNDRTQIE